MQSVYILQLHHHGSNLDDHLHVAHAHLNPQFHHNSGAFKVSQVTSGSGYPKYLQREDYYYAPLTRGRSSGFSSL